MFQLLLSLDDLGEGGAKWTGQSVVKSHGLSLPSWRHTGSRSAGDCVRKHGVVGNLGTLGISPVQMPIFGSEALEHSIHDFVVFFFIQILVTEHVASTASFPPCFFT